MLKKALFSLAFAFIMTSKAPLHADNFIFDLGRVLVDTDPVACMRYIGIKNIVHCMYALRKSPHHVNNHLKNKLFEILTQVAHEHHTIIGANNYCAYDEHGIPLPALMCEWLAGTMTCNDIKNLIFNSLEIHPEWFVCSAEKSAIYNLTTMIFTPEHFVATRKVYRDGIMFIKSCKKKGHKVYALSNWDAESFVLLHKKFPQLFDLFDGIVISGESNNLKPSPDIYSTLLNRYNLNPSACWFIDDQKENVEAAHLLGIQSVLCTHNGLFKKPDFHAITQIVNNLHYTSVPRREKRKNKGIIPNTTKNTSNPIIVGEKIS